MRKKRREHQIPLVKAAFIEPFRIAMERNGISADAYFRKFRLPVSMPADAETLVPEKPFWQLINQVATAEMIPDFGMQIAQSKPWHEIESLRPLLSGQSSLRTVLQKFCDLAGGQSNVSAFRLRLEAGTCWFESQCETLVSHDIQMENYRVTSMIEMIQLAAGKNWKPLVVHLMMDRNRVIPSNRLLDGCRLEFSRSSTAISLPVGLLDARVQLGKARDDLAGPVEEIVDKSEFLTALQTIIDQYVLDKDLSIDLIADLSECSPRTLQRLLKEQGLKYNDMVQNARMRHAVAMLRDSDLSITEIALRLGYNDTAHFTRAFRRWTGMTPSKYRRNAHVTDRDPQAVEKVRDEDRGARETDSNA
jgi:AraC-like DNA-binding protein